MPQRIFITDRDIVGHSRHHTVYIGDKDSEKTDSGHHSRIIRQVFINGQARNVPENVYRQLKDQGHASTERIRKDEDD